MGGRGGGRVGSGGDGRGGERSGEEKRKVVPPMLETR